MVVRWPIYDERKINGGHFGCPDMIFLFVFFSPDFLFPFPFLVGQDRSNLIWARLLTPKRFGRKEQRRV